MAEVLHSNLTGADLHESKGAAAANLGTVAVATGLGTAIFTNLDYSYIANVPLTPSVSFNGTAVVSKPIVKNYIVTASAGSWSQAITGITTLHGVQATAVGGSTYATAAFATVASATTATVSGNVFVNGVLGTTQTVYLTVYGV